MPAAKKIEKDHYLFREGEAPDAMYVVKTGKLAVVKMKQNSEVVLAEIGPGSMVGEMAFFDGKPRSASIKAIKDSELIVLPYKSLHSQFSTFPEWCKAIMRTVNEHLRNANQRLRQLERPENEDTVMFPPHVITKMVSILNLVGHRYGKASEEGVIIPGGILRNYTIQIFQEATHKMQKLTSTLADLDLMIFEDIGEGKTKTVIKNPELLFSFVEWYNDWLFKQDKDRVHISEPELKVLAGLIHFAKKTPPGANGEINLNLTEIQNDSMRELKYLIKVEDSESLVEKKIIGDKMMKDNAVYSKINIGDLEKTVPYWKIIYALQKVHR